MWGTNKINLLLKLQYFLRFHLSFLLSENMKKYGKVRKMYHSLKQCEFSSFWLVHFRFSVHSSLCKHHQVTAKFSYSESCTKHLIITPTTSSIVVMRGLWRYLIFSKHRTVYYHQLLVGTVQTNIKSFIISCVCIWGLFCPRLVLGAEWNYPPQDILHWPSVHQGSIKAQ